MAFLKSGVDHGPSALVLDGVATSLMRKGCMFKQPDGKFAVSDLGRQTVAASRGENSTLQKVPCLAALLLCALALNSVGCATPHRSTLTEHTVEKFANRTDGLIARETWRDKDSGGALFLFTDPSSQGMCIKHTNQTELGGSTWMMMAPFSSVVDSNLVPFVATSGTAIGNVIGAAAKSAVK